MINRRGWPRYYVLLDRVPIAAGEESWKRALEARFAAKDDPWSVGRTSVNDRCEVSTVFLGLDHRFWGGRDPLLFETAIFGGPLEGETWRYTTWAEAERGHADAVAEARKAAATIDVLAREAGAKNGNSADT